MRIKGKGNVGIGNTNPLAKLTIVQQGLYTRSEGQGNAIEIIDTAGTDHTLYMGADATNQIGFIQSVATGGFRDLALQPRGGNVVIGKDQSSSLAVKGNVIVDNGSSNTGTTGNWLQFGSTSFRYGFRQFLDMSLSETLVGLASGETDDAGSDKRF